jgi:hypothetical protein
MKRTVLWSVISVVVVVIGTGAVFDHPGVRSASVVAAKESGSAWTFEGCWTQFQAGTCYDIYRDSSGNYWKCAKCGTTKRANQNTCASISLEALNRGFWCS